MKRTISACLVALCTALTPIAQARAHSEILFGLLQHADPSIARQPGWAAQPLLKEAAIEDLAAISAAIMRIPILEKLVEVEPTEGKAIAVAHQFVSPDPELATGVTVWPDWQVADETISFDDASHIEFLSCHHVMLTHRPRSGGFARIVDVRVPDVRFQLRGYRLNSLRVTDSGMWVCVGQDGLLYTGKFDPLNPTASVTGSALPLTGPIVNLLLRNDGGVLVVEKPDRVLTVYRTSDWVQTAVASGRIAPDIHFQSHPVGRDSFVGTIKGKGANLITVTASGQISWEQMPHQKNGETTNLLSLSRKFASTQKHGWPPGAVHSYDRTTQFADANDVFPTFPPVPKDAYYSQSGWLRCVP